MSLASQEGGGFPPDEFATLIGSYRSCDLAGKRWFLLNVNREKKYRTLS